MQYSSLRINLQYTVVQLNGIFKTKVAYHQGEAATSTCSKTNVCLVLTLQVIFSVLILIATGMMFFVLCNLLSMFDQFSLLPVYRGLQSGRLVIV
jgi:hypothetical protein